MAEVGDPEYRHHRATEEEDTHTVAEALMILKYGRLSDPPSLEEEDDEGPSVTPPPPLNWRSKRKRSRKITMAGILEAKREEEEGAAKAKGTMRVSPPSPLDYPGGSGASTSGGENGPRSPEDLPAVKRPRLGESFAVRGDSSLPRKVVRSERPPPVSRVRERKSIKPSGKKKTILLELQAMEKSLLEEREKLQKELEAQRKDNEALFEQNSRLELDLELRSLKPTISMVPTETKQPESSYRIDPSPVQGRRDFVLPDLNEPLPD